MTVVSTSSPDGVSTSSTSGGPTSGAITRVLVANRGEIASRVFRTCRDLGIGTVAVHSDPDAGLAFVAEADAAVRLPGSTPAETYLRADLIVAAALAAGADAVHPGYGFLSESADFARAVRAAGLVWVGPTPESIEQMGSKVEAKRLMEKAGVPVLANVGPVDAVESDFPLLVKASAGGGGRGMRIVRTPADLVGAVEQASAEAASAFGDPTVFCEPYVERGRHVEVQIWGDHHGNNVSVLGARDCSVQRRHQKLVEESPPSGLGSEKLEELYAAARAAGHAIGYVGVGTVEFLLDPATGRFWFLEMNTRLQVEHPVTECVTGADLVALQLTAAEDPTALGVGHTGEGGHAVEARLYAEDPAADYRPQSGRLTRFEIPSVSARFDNLAGYGVRVDAGFRAGDEIGTHYDAMLAKVVCWAPTREAALRRLADVLARSEIHGVRTNRDLLVAVLRHQAFVAGDVHTGFLEQHDLVRSGPTSGTLEISALAAAVALAERSARGRSVQRGVPSGWRNVVSAPHTTRFVSESPGGHHGTTADESRVGEGVVVVRWHGGRDGYRSADLEVTVVAAGPDRVVIEQGGVTRAFTVHATGDQVDVESDLGHVALRRTPRFVDPAAEVATGSLLAPMPGTVVALAVEAGAEVVAGQTVLVLEAMKMQHTVIAPHDGVVSELTVRSGDQVAAGAVLAVVHPPEGDAR